MTPRAAIVALAAVVVAAGSASLGRPGYSPDEEFTLFAVRGIDAHGLPLLPSGLLYDRGLLYSYAAWFAGAVSGLELPAFRALSLLAASGALVMLFAVVRRAVPAGAALGAAGLAAASVPFWAVATTARFYAPFLLACLVVLWLAARCLAPRPHPAGALGCGLALATAALAARLTHELAFTLMAVPAAGLSLGWFESSRTGAPPEDRAAAARAWLRVAAAIAVGLVAAQALLTALHYVMPRGEGGTMIERFFLWQVLNLFERPQGVPLGVVFAALVVAWLLAPARAGLSLRVAAASAAVVMAIGVALAAATAPLSVGLVHEVARDGLRYPLDMMWHVAGSNPVMLVAALALLGLRLGGAGGDWPARERAAHLAWTGWMLWFGVIESGITLNYLLLPTVGLLTAIAVDLAAIGRRIATVWPGPRARLVRAVLAAVALAVVADLWSGTGSLAGRLADARPTIHVAGLDAVRRDLRAPDRVACTDELACLLLVGRVDAWLALDDYVRERFTVMREGREVGVYAGTPAAFRPSTLFDGVAGPAAGRVIVVDVFKEYPIGHSAAWLPRALESDRLGFRTLLVTPQARVVEVRRPRDD